MKGYNTYIVNFLDAEQEFDYFIFHSKTSNELDENYDKLIKQFKKLWSADYGIKFDGMVNQLIKYKENNYPKVN